MSTFIIKRFSSSLKKAVIELSSSSVKLLIGAKNNISLRNFKSISERTKTTDGLQGSKMNILWYKTNVLPVILEYKNICDKEGIEDIIITATAVYRKSSNCSLIFDIIQEIVGIRPMLLTGQLEAELAPLSFLILNKHYHGWILFIDQGRGSTELSLVSPQREIEMSYSIPHGNDDIRTLGSLKIINNIERNKEAQKVLKEAIFNKALLVGSGGILTKNERFNFKRGSFVSGNDLDDNIFCIFNYIMKKVGDDKLLINQGDSTIGAFFKY